MKKFGSLALTLLICCFIGACAHTTIHEHTPHTNDKLRMGKELMHQKEYKMAFYRLEPLAQAGNPQAQYAVGYMYFYGKGVIEDRKIANMWIRAAAAQGDPLAQNAIRQIALEQQITAHLSH